MANNRNKDFGTKKDTRITPPDVTAGLIEYKMSRKMAENIVNSKKGKNPQEILCNYVNTNLGLKGYCVKVLVDL